ncbi:PyrK [Desulforapulum autotrophicum HRM2]|uniref:PyrK n=2 Tax=Desulforapulum autotrophicum TaxID=2296 RepID=C0QCN3_DESAH|nr:PyrK [Desulforapulum autotrophicum HRM2]
MNRGFRMFFSRNPLLLLLELVILFFVSGYAIAGNNIFYIDADGDGYGVGTEYVLGPDADDNDPAINTPDSVLKGYPSLTNFLKSKGYGSKRIIYISSRGNDDTGLIDDIQKPFFSWAKVRSQIKPGDTIIYRGGIYREQISLKNMNGTKDEPVTFMAYPGEAVWFEDCGGSGNSAAISIKGGSHINIQGIIFDNPSNFGNGNGVYLNGTTQYDWTRVHDIKIKNIEVKNTKSGVRAMVNIHNLVVEDSVIHDTSSHNIYLGTSDDSLPNGDILIKNNLLYRGARVYNGRFCIQHNGIVDRLIIENNICHSNQTGGGISLENGASNSIVRNNLIFNNSKMGIQLYGYNAKWGGAFSNNHIFNNTIWVGNYSPTGVEEPKDHAGILLKDSSGRFNILGTIIKNNIISTQFGYPVHIFQENFIATTLMEKNIFYRQKGREVVHVGENAYKLERIEKERPLVRDNLFADPKFKNVSIQYYKEPRLFDFDILNNSPAIDFGLNVKLEKDISGHSRIPEKNDSGCYEFTADNSSPVFKENKACIVYVDENNQMDLAATDKDGDKLSFKCRNLPGNAQMTGSLFQWKPDLSQKGDTRLLFNVSDGSSEDRILVMCHVVERNDERSDKTSKNTDVEPLAERKVKVVSNIKDLRDAVRDLKAGDELLIEPGIYNGGFRAWGLQGTKRNPIVIAGKDPDDLPVFSGRGEAVKLSNVAYLKLKNLRISDFTGNGINMDDGGNLEEPSNNIIIENISIKEIGPKGNYDAIKMSGVDDFIVRDCHIEGWGGSGIDLVGCHQGIIQACQFLGTPGYRTKNAIQIKGGSHNILVQETVFINCGERVINIGGSTGTAYFRPQLVDYEAKNVIIAGNRFIGGSAQVAWVTSQDTHVHHNIFYLPEKYVGRILQETKNKLFKPSQKGHFEANLVVTDERIRTFFNVGPRTAPKSFVFSRNAWYRFNSQDKPKLPTREIEGIYGVYPDLKDFGTAQMKIDSKNSRLKDVGPRAYVPWHVKTDFDDVEIPRIEAVLPVPDKGVDKQLVLICGLFSIFFMIMVIRFVRKRK